MIWSEDWLNEKDKEIRLAKLKIRKEFRREVLEELEKRLKVKIHELNRMIPGRYWYLKGLKWSLDEIQELKTK